MIQRLIDYSLRHRAVILIVYIAAGAWGYWALRSASVDAIPDLSDHQVIVFTDWAGHSAQEVEDQVTYPLTVNLQGLAGVRVVRSQSAFGFSMIYVVFDDDVDLYFARARVLERLGLVSKALPAGVVPTLGPDATGVGHVFWYTVESPCDRCAICAACRTGSSAISSMRCRASRRSRRSAAPSSSTRSTSIPTGCAATACRWATSSRRAREQRQRRRQRRRSQRRLVDRARRRPASNRVTTSSAS